MFRFVHKACSAIILLIIVYRPVLAVCLLILEILLPECVYYTVLMAHSLMLIIIENVSLNVLEILTLLHKILQIYVKVHVRQVLQIQELNNV